LAQIIEIARCSNRRVRAAAPSGRHHPVGLTAA
jgi:hypothetical protein